MHYLQQASLCLNNELNNLIRNEINIMVNPSNNNAIVTLYNLLQTLKVKITYRTVKDSLLQHPDFPSMLSLSEVLSTWHVDNAALQVTSLEQIEELQLPFIAHLTTNNGWFVVVTSMLNGVVIYRDSTNGITKDLLNDFKKKWSGVVLLAEASEQSGEIKYKSNRNAEIRDKLRQPFLYISFLLVSVYIGVTVHFDFLVHNYILLISKNIGLVLSILLLAKQLGSENNFINYLCRINATTDCGNILNSPASKLFGWISWTEIGFIYFAGGLLSTILLVNQHSTLILLYGMSLLALPYVFFSVYYQYRVVKQWCPLCLGVQFVLLIEGVLAWTNLPPLIIQTQPYFTLLIGFLIPTMAWVISKPFLIYAHKSQQEHDELLQFKRDSTLFGASIRSQPQMLVMSNDLKPIILGNPDATHTVTMVTNPFCEPCAEAHSEIEELIQKNQDVNAKIIFLACDGKSGKIHRAAVHLLNLHDQQPKANFLKKWYEDKQKNLEEWDKKISSTDNLESHDYNKILEQHCGWCRQAGLDTTPTLYVDGFKVPEIYRINELHWLINELEPEITV